jgi:hypothetical protein
VAGAFSIFGVDVTGAGEAPVLCLLGEGRLKLPSPLDVVRNFSAESSIMAHSRVGTPLRVEPIKVAPASPLLEERLRPPN